MLLNEIKLKQTDKLQIQNYHTILRPRPDNSGHGEVAILVKRGIPITNLQNAQSTIEHQGIKFLNGLVVILAYKPPSKKFTEQSINNLLDIAAKVLILGDFNAKHQHWNCDDNNRNGLTLLIHSTIGMTSTSYLHTEEHTHTHTLNNMLK